MERIASFSVQNASFLVGRGFEPKPMNLKTWFLPEKQKRRMRSIPSSSFTTLPMEAVQKSQNFHPTIWGDYFLSRTPLPSVELEMLRQRISELKAEVKKMVEDTSNQLQILELIDSIQRLGVAHHMSKEINDALGIVYHTAGTDYYNLHATALRFRILRQNKYHISSDVFKKFLNTKGEFSASLSSNVKALLSLYEAAHLAMPGEEILEKAIGFAKNHLNKLLMNNSIEQHYVMMVTHAMNVPLIRGIERLQVRHYLEFYEKDSNRNQVLLEFAKEDFHLMQALYQEEAKSLSLWWKKLGLVQCLSFTRDRLIEYYFTSIGAFVEPRYSYARTVTTKVFGLISNMDDIYDSYGTVEELQLLTITINRWELDGVQQLPDYLQVYFHALYKTFEELDDELSTNQTSYRLQYLKDVVKSQAQAYLEEAKWGSEGFVPSLEDNLSVSLITSGVPLITCIAFVCTDEEISTEVLDFITGFPEIVKASALICRVLNDIATHEYEGKRKSTVATTVESYVKDYGCSKIEACEKLSEMVENAWKIINKELYSLSKLPLPLIWPMINLARVCQSAYENNGDAYTNSELMKQKIASILVDPILE